MTGPSFAELTDKTRLDRLKGEILAFVSDLDQEGYDNMEIVRALVAAASIRAHRETSLVSENFHQHMRDISIRYLADKKTVIRDLAGKYFKLGN